MLCILCAECCKQRTYTDPCRTKIVDLIDLQAGINLAAAIQDLINLICCNCIQTTSKGIELDQIQVILCLDKVCCRIQTGMIHPLVIDTDRTLYFCQMRNRILCKYSNAIAVDQIRDTMMDLRVYMVWTTSKNDSSSTGIFEVLKSLLAFFLHIFTRLCEFFPCRMGCCLYFLCRNIPKHLYQTVCQDCFGRKRHKRVHKFDIRVFELIHIVLDVFRIRSNDRAVVMVDRIRELISFIRNTRIENKLHTLFDQPAHMTMCQFRRITLRLTRDGLNAKLVDFSGRSR